jgi:hypothetical protein
VERLANRRVEAVRELLLVAGMFGLYEFIRSVLNGHVTQAFANANNVWSLERWLHLPDEATLQTPFLTHPALAEATNVYYAVVHFPVTLGMLVILWVFRPVDYRWTRTVMALLTFTSLVIHAVFPLAPPRMLSADGMVDLARMYGPAVYGPSSTSGFSDQFAAMPSLHVGWALLVAVALIRVTTSRWRWLLLLYPATTLSVVLVTGNHYWMDAIVAAALLPAAVAVRELAPSARALLGRQLVQVRRVVDLDRVAPARYVAPLAPAFLPSQRRAQSGSVDEIDLSAEQSSDQLRLSLVDGRDRPAGLPEPDEVDLRHIGIEHSQI